MTQPMTNQELVSSIRYLSRQLSYLDGETPLSEADEAMIRERNDYLREAKSRGLSF